MSHGIAEHRAEAEWLCSVVARHADQLRRATFAREFQLDRASFRLHAKDRNTLYRVSAQFQWFLKMTPAGDEQVGRERLGARVIAEALAGRSEYCGATVVRVGTDPSYVLASHVPGQPLSRALVTDAWRPTSGPSARLEEAFGTLGLLLATLHARSRIDADAPPATKRPFDSLKGAARRLRTADALSREIDACLARHSGGERSDFVHGNMRLDNVMVWNGRIGFIDLEHCGTGSFYQDLSRPVAQLLLTRAAVAFPHRRVAGYLGAFLRAYESVRPYDPRELNDYVFARLAKYCVDNRRSAVPQRIGGIPILNKRLERLALALIDEGLHAAVPGLRAHAAA